MKISISKQILSAALLPLLLVLSVLFIISVNTVKKEVHANAVSSMENYSVFAKYLIEDYFKYSNDDLDSSFENIIRDFPELRADKYSKDRKLVMFNKTGFIYFGGTDTEESLLSIAFKNNSKHMVEILSDAIENEEFLVIELNSLFSSGKSYVNIIPVFTANPNDNPVFLFTEIPSTVFRSEYQTALQLIFIFGITGFILVFICSLLVSRNIKMQIKQLHSAAVSKTEGNSDVVFSPAGRRFAYEIRLLGSALDNMDAKTRHEAALIKNNLETLLTKENEHISGKGVLTFFTKMSHEIRTPINSILGIAQILLTENKLSEPHKKYVRDVKTSTDALLSIINDILDLFKLSSGKMPLVPHDYDFLQFIDVLSAYAGKGSEKKSLEYRFETIGKPPLSLYGDEKRLMKVLKNIISNAVKYTKKGFISFKIIINEDDITFEIRDSGKGIKPDSIESLFNVFEQEENVTGINEHADKTGLDLPIAKKLIALMDGKLNVVSEYGVGSVFTVSIPKIIGDINKLTLKPAKTDLFFAENTRILIVDDNEMNLEVAKGLITSLYGIQCDTALSGTEAVLCAKKNVYDLVFMDHIMPEMSGTETAHRIRDAGGSNRSLPIIALTVNTVIGIKDLLIKEGMNDFLAKPIIIDEMTDILRKWLPKEKRIQKTVMTDEHDFVKEENRVIKAAEMIAALDVKSGLTNVAGKEKVYEKSLKLLSEKIPKMITTMEDALNDNNIGDFTIHVHGLKSSLAVVGANSLSKTAFTLEKAGKEKNMDFCKETLPDFVRQLHDLKKKISAVFDSEAPESDNASGKPKGEREKAVAFLEALKEAAGNYDFETLTGTITQMSEFDFGSKMNSDVVKLKNLSELFNYSGIQTVIDELKTEIQNNPAFFE